MNMVQYSKGYGDRCPYGRTADSLVQTEICEFVFEDRGQRIFGYYVPTDILPTFFLTDSSVFTRIFDLKTSLELNEFVKHDIRHVFRDNDDEMKIYYDYMSTFVAN